MTKQVTIDDSNFNEYFFDVRKHGPKKNHILARFSAIADFVDGQMKQDIIYLLTTMHNGGGSAVKVMQKLGCATYEAAIDVCSEIAEDLKAGHAKGMDADVIGEEVEKKIYSYHYEQFFYTEASCVPKADIHWDVIQIHNLNEHLDKVDGVGEVHSKIIKPKPIESEDSEAI